MEKEMTVSEMCLPVLRSQALKRFTVGLHFKEAAAESREGSVEEMGLMMNMAAGHNLQA
jgi:hypothetical protein